VPTLQKVLLVHGLAGSPRWWRPILPQLEARYDVRLLDLRRTRPAQGAAALERELADAGGDAALVGHSLGGLLCAQLAARRKVAKLVLVSPAGMPSGRPRALEPLALAATLRTATLRFLPVLAMDALRWGPLALARGGRYALSVDLQPDLNRIAAPTLLVWGERDVLVPRRLAESWRDAIPNARLAIVPRAGHVPMCERPQPFLAALLDFLEDERRHDVGR
jgi:pimeloyl-ACP methyl ester carboxylesterase